MDKQIYAPAAQSGWMTLRKRIREDGQIEGLCVGTTAAYDDVMAGAEMITLLRNFNIEHKLNTFHYRTKS